MESNALRAARRRLRLGGATATEVTEAVDAVDAVDAVEDTDVGGGAMGAVAGSDAEGTTAAASVVGWFSVGEVDACCAAAMARSYATGRSPV